MPQQAARTPIDLIRALAPRYGLDPHAVMAVARAEGGLGWGAVGDNGTSFGPFQLHVGGALPKGRDAAWANSAEGIDYALGKMAAAGASGQTGAQAIGTIVRKFERPADPNSEVRRASSYYGQAGAPQQPQTQTPTAFANGQTTRTSAPPTNATDPRARLASMLLARSMQRRGHEMSPLLAQMLAQHATPSPRPAAPTPPKQTPPAAETPTPAAAGGGLPSSPSGAGIRELFYDPLGAYDEGNWINPIGGHSDHVHASFGTPEVALASILLAQQMGLRATENPYAEGSPAEPGVHTATSYHYRNFPGMYDGRQLGMGLDVSGAPNLMADYFKRLRQAYIGGGER